MPRILQMDSQHLYIDGTEQYQTEGQYPNQEYTQPYLTTGYPPNPNIPQPVYPAGSYAQGDMGAVGDNWSSFVEKLDRNGYDQAIAMFKEQLSMIKGMFVDGMSSVEQISYAVSSLDNVFVQTLAELESVLDRLFIFVFVTVRAFFEFVAV